MDQCGEASAATKLSALSLQDRSLLTAKKRQALAIAGRTGRDDKAEYFEFAEKKDENKWASEFVNNKPSTLPQSKMFEDIFNKALPSKLTLAFPSSATATATSTSASNSTSTSTADWIKDFQDQRSVQQQPSNPVEFEKFNKIFDSIAVGQDVWAKEFAKHEIEEFKSQELNSQEFGAQESIDETAQSARILLESLDLSDSKLASSKFVAYLKELTENDQTINGTFNQNQNYNWEREFQNSMEAAGLTNDVEDDKWKNLEKAWDKYEFSGKGYEQFASKEFAQYRYSIQDALNPFHGLGSEAIKSDLSALKSRDLAKYILALEELTRLLPGDANIWQKLGIAQAENELDVQAIAAFYRAVKIDPKMNVAWMGLGAACVNEYCIPDALDAFKSILVNYLGDSISIDQSTLLASLISVFRNKSLIPDESIRVGALSVLLNISGDHDEAITLLQNSSTNLNEYSIWNRLGATLANSNRYDEAIKAYERALNLNPTYVRALYNMAVSYMNQSNYAKSMEFMVRALQYHLPVSTSSQSPDQSVLSESLKTGYDNIWNTMRIVGDMWGRDDINVLIEERNLTALMSILKEVL